MSNKTAARGDVRLRGSLGPAPHRCCHCSRHYQNLRYLLVIGPTQITRNSESVHGDNVNYYCQSIEGGSNTWDLYCHCKIQPKCTCSSHWFQEEYSVWFHLPWLLSLVFVLSLSPCFIFVYVEVCKIGHLELATFVHLSLKNFNSEVVSGARSSSDHP